MSADLLGLLLDNVGTAILAVDDRQRIGIFNAAAQGVLDTPATSVIGRCLSDCVADTLPQALSELCLILQHSIENGVELRRQTVVVDQPSDKEREPRIFGYTVTPLLEEDGMSAGGLLVFSDLTDVKQRERQQSETDRFAQVGRVASWMAHEIKNPLATIQMYAGLIGRKGGPDVQEAVRVIRDQVVQAQSRISEVLRTLSLRTPETREPAVTELGALVREYVERETGLVPHVTIEYRQQEGSHRVPLDRGDALSLVSNLVANAVEAIAGPGAVTLDVRSTHDMVTLTVLDTGSGFPDDPQRLLQPFFTSKPRGTGLGLWVVRKIVDNVGGVVALENGDQGGALVTVTLPAIALGSLRGRRILVAEDETVLRRLICKQLSTFGAQTIEAANGDEALRLLESNLPDIVLTDMRMPGADGSEVARRTPSWLPVLLMSGVIGAEIEHHDLRRKGLAFLSKPFDVEDLGLALAYVLWEVAS
jgi:nitrogen fixation/metabolism regulation signal transduction histidine kinase